MADMATCSVGLKLGGWDLLDPVWKILFVGLGRFLGSGAAQVVYFPTSKRMQETVGGPEERAGEGDIGD